MGDAFRDAGQLLIQRGLVLLLLSAALVFTGTAGSSWLRAYPLFKGAGYLIGLANWLSTWLAQAAPHSLFIAAVSWTAAEVLQGRSPPLGETLRQGLRFSLPVLAVQALYFLGVMAGTMLLIVPGVIVALMWIVATQAVIVERMGIIEAFKHSRTLTKGHRWALLGLVVASVLIVVAVEWVIFRIVSPGSSFTQAAVAPLNAYGVVPLIGALGAPLSATVMTAIYMRLRSGHRGSADRTAEVFA